MKEKRSILTGGLVLATLGILLFLQRTTAFGFDRSWPIFLIAIGGGMVMKSLRDPGGWIVGGVGIVFLLLRNGHLPLGQLSVYVLPVILVLAGATIIWKSFR